MRFVVTGEWNRNQLLRLILFFFLVYILMFWATNWIMYFQKMSLDPASVVSFYLGDPDAEFGRPPRPLGARKQPASIGSNCISPMGTYSPHSYHHSPINVATTMAEILETACGFH